jgi:Pvc16 N-terminal domain
MIHEVDESLRKVILRDALNGSGAELAFDAPTKEWAAKRNKPTVDLYLYDIREDLGRRDVGYERVRDRDGLVTGRQPPPRRFALSYIVTAWTQRPEDEHRLLSAILACFLRFEALPEDVLEGSLTDQPLPVLVKVALPPAEDRSISDLWTALGGELKPSLDLVVTAPFDLGRAAVAGPPVLEGLRFEGGGARRRRRAAAAPPDEEPPEAPPEVEETIAAGSEKQPGRTLRIRPVRPS